MPDEPAPMHGRLVRAEVARNGEERRPEIFDQSIPELAPKRPVESLVVDESVPRHGRAAERTTRDEDVMRAAIDALGIRPAGERRCHRGADARATQHVEIRAGFAEGLVDAEVGAPERSAAARDEADRGP